MHPTVHSNGTSKQALYGQLRAVLDALRATLTAMREASPNGRDYYPQGEGAYTKAAQEHGERMAQVDALIEEYTAMIEHLLDTYGWDGIR